MRVKFPGLRSVTAGLGGLALVLLAGVWDVAGAQTPERSVGEVFRDCALVCPELVVVPSGSFTMGSATTGWGGSYGNAGPLHRVTIPRAIAIGRYEVTFDEWDACVAESGCRLSNNRVPNGPGYDEGWGRARRPLMNVSWNEAQLYVRWLSTKTGQAYRLLSESEWEYAARAGTTTRFSTGDTISAADANLALSGLRRTLPVGSFAPNAFGLYDMHGNVDEWVQDCYAASYRGAPTDGSALLQASCHHRITRGGNFSTTFPGDQTGARGYFPGEERNPGVGLRVARIL